MDVVTSASTMGLSSPVTGFGSLGGLSDFRIRPKTLRPKTMGGSRANPHSKIMFGTRAKIGEFPFQVSLTSTEFNGTHFCGGSIINSLFILTAAHCVLSVDNPSSISVTAGIVDAENKNSRSRQVRRVKTAHIHESFDEITQYNDLALLELTSPFELNNRSVKAVYLEPTPMNWTGEAVVSGWGLVEDKKGEKSSRFLLKANMPIYSVAACETRYSRYGGVSLSPRDICAGGKLGDACRGDSGGALSGWMNKGTRQVLVGVVSRGVYCNRNNPPSRTRLPSIYVNVSKYTRWIQATMERMRIQN